MFEGSMYLFVFFWPPALRSAAAASRPAAAHAPGGELPYGTIFASFMAATLASSLAFNVVMERRLVRYSTLLALILGGSALCFFLLAAPAKATTGAGAFEAGARSEQTTFWLFCAFEALVGMYFPCMGFLKGQLVGEAIRARVYGFLRIPLNGFVVLALLVTGDGAAHDAVFGTCARLLLASSAALFAMSLLRHTP